MFNPAKITGSALGNITIRNVCHRVARSDRISSIRSGSVDLRPLITLTSTGKKATVAAITTLDVMPKPNQMMNNGAIATFGVVWIAIR